MSNAPEESEGPRPPSDTIAASTVEYAVPRFAINPLSTERRMANGAPAVTFHALNCRLVRHDARYFTALVEVEEWVEETPWTLVPCVLCNPRQEVS